MTKKPKHAIYYSVNSGRNDGPPLYYFNVMKSKLGYQVDHLDPTGPDVDRNGPYDYHWWIDWGEDAVLGKEKALEDMIPQDGGKRIYVVSDAHLDDGYRFEKAKQFDYIFFNQAHYLEEYTGWKIGKNDMDKKTFDLKNGLRGWHKYPNQLINYLPHAAEPQAYPHFEIIKKWDLVFIGHIQEYHKGNGINMSRLDVLDAVFKAIPNFYFGTRSPLDISKNMFEDAAKKFCQSKVVFNISIGNDLNMRFFETLVAGGFLLTNDIPELKSAEQYGFYPGVHYVPYSSLEDAIAKARYYITHDEERERIAKAGYKQALKTGTYEARIKEIISKVG